MKIMKRILLIVLILIFSSFVGINHDASASSGRAVEWVEVDRISTTVEIDPMSNYYFHISNSEIKYIMQEKIPVMDALKRVPNWLRDDLEKNFEKMACVDIDVGDHAAPTAFDIDNDGDLDLVVGTSEGKIIIYENSNNVWIKKGFLNDSNGNPIAVSGYATPTFFDLYNDGKTDLIVGASDGRVRYYENTDKGFVNKGYLKDNNGNTINVGSYSAPVFADLTSEANQYPGTKHVDLTIGSGDGALYYYENTGYYAHESNWSSKDIYSDVNIYLQALDHPARYSKPALVDLDADGDFDLTVGADSGKMYYFRNVGTSTNPSWSYALDMYNNMETCAYAAPVLADMDRNKLMTTDCLYDIVVGRGDGHIHLYKNVGTSITARWDVFPYASEAVSYHLQERNLSYVEKYVNLILDVENEYVDEIAFCIAHTSPDVLTDEDVYLDVFKKNAELIYEIDPYIRYANLVEEGNYSTGDYWTTIRYNYSEKGVVKNTTLPPDIYYWFVVHPKITDEIPTFINPETGRADENGVFWREYLFYHADENYPSDPSPDYRYPKDEKTPLLKDKILNITIMYDNTPYTAPAGYDNHGHYFEDNPRNWGWSYDKGHAVEVVSNWVEKTLPLNEQESDDGERPIQPVRIAHHHNGNCGELQDLTVAAARTCMIPAAGVSLIGEDHVWSEFYCLNESRDYHWHQWDNYWSDGGSVIDDFTLYWEGWGERGGSGIFRWWGDDSITDVTGYYVPTAAFVEVVVKDAGGWAVDGAKVVVSSYWRAENAVEGIAGATFGIGYVPGAAIPSIWGYTNSDGVCEFRLAGTNFNFNIQVTSKLGSDSKSNVEIKEGEYYTGDDAFVFKLQDTKPRPEPKIDTSWSTGEIYKIDIEYGVMYGELDGGNYVMEEYYGVPNEHPEYVSANIDFFTCTKLNMEKYLNNKEAFKYDQIGINQTSLSLSSVNTGEDTYVVFSNDDSVELKKIINITIILKKYQPEITVNINPVDTLSGINATISGTASTGVKNVWVRVDDKKWENANGTTNWNYKFNTTEYYPGQHIIYARAWDGWDYTVTYTQVVFLNDLPIINILSVSPISDDGMVYGSVSVHGTVSSINPVQKMEVKIGDTNWKKASLDKEGRNWWYNNTNTVTVNDGKQKIDVKAFNGIMYTVASVEVIVDNNPPDVNILSLSENSVVSGSITVRGNASDINGVKKIGVRIDEENWTTVGTASLPSWDYSLGTTKLSEGKHTIYVSAFDGLHYKNISVNITVDNNRPPEILYSPYSPANDNVIIKENSTQTFKVVNNVDSEGGGIIIQWFLNGELVGTEPSYTFTAKYTGEYSSDNSPFYVKVAVSDTYWYDGKMGREYTNHTWVLTVENVNRAPVINNFTPADSPITMNEGESKTFSIINASDPDGTAPAITWYRYLSGESKGDPKGSGSIYTFYSDYNSAGTHIIEAVVSDGEKSISMVWVLTVKDVNRAFTFDGFSPNQTEIEMKKGSGKTFSVINGHDPENNLTIKWYVNGEFVDNKESYTFIPTSYGTYILSVTISDGGKIETHSWTINVKKHEEAPGFEVLSLLIVLGMLIILRKIKRKAQ